MRQLCALRLKRPQLPAQPFDQRFTGAADVEDTRQLPQLGENVFERQRGGDRALLAAAGAGREISADAPFRQPRPIGVSGLCSQ